jgi:uncharacterized protein YdiU (UPF0061 family)
MAAAMNFKSLCTAVAPLLKNSPEHTAALHETLKKFPAVANDALNAMFARKLGLKPGPGAASAAHALLQLMEAISVDYTLLFRELSTRLPRDVTELLAGNVFYEDSTVSKDGALAAQWTAWLDNWHRRLSDDQKDRPMNTASVRQQMLQENPKFVPREWMLVEAYRRAGIAGATGDYSLVHTLHRLFETPYDEHDAELDLVKKYFRRAPFTALDEGGTSRMS